jgi:WD40 repeat protein
MGRIYEYLKNPENYLIKDMKFNFNDELFFDRTKYKSIKTHNDSVQCVICLNDGRLASSSNDASIKIYELNTFKCQMTIKEHQDSVFYLTQLKNGNLVSSSEDSTIKIIRLISNKEYNVIQTLLGHSNAVMKTIELSNGKLMSCSTDEKIKIWSKKINDKNNYQYNYNLHYQCETTILDEEKIYSIIEIPNVNELITSEGESIIKFYDLNKYNVKKSFNDMECSGWTYSLCIINKDYLGIGGNCLIYIIRISTHTIIKIISTENKIICLYRVRDDSILTGDLYGKIRQWKFNGSDLIPIKEEISAHKEKIPTIVQLIDGTIATGSYDSKIKLWK